MVRQVREYVAGSLSKFCFKIYHDPVNGIHKLRMNPYKVITIFRITPYTWFLSRYYFI